MTEIQQVGPKTREILISPDACPPFAEAGIVLAGISHAADGFSFVRHRPNFFQILACQGGEGLVWVENKWLVCRAGEIYLTPPESFHAYRAVPRKSWQLAWVNFRAPEEALTAPRLIRAGSEGFAETIQALHRECVGLQSPVLIRQLVDILLFYQRRIIDPSSGDERLLRLWSRVDSVLHEPWDLDRLAESLHMSAEHFRRICHRHHGKSPMSILRNMRMRRAATLLQRSMTPIDEIAAQVGYSDPFAFSKAFKRFFKLSPSRQRKVAPTETKDNLEE